MRLREWVDSTSDDGARSWLNCQYLHALLHQDSLVDKPTSISVKQMTYTGIRCIRLDFRLPQMFQAAGVTSIPVLVPNGLVGTGISEDYIFYALIEKIIGWLVGIGSTHLLIRLHHELGKFAYDVAWDQLTERFTPLINSLREHDIGEVGTCHALPRTPLLKLFWSSGTLGTSRALSSVKLTCSGR